MSNLTDVLYGNRLYGAATYAANLDPQTLTANLGDIQTSSDADVARITHALADSQATVDAVVKTVEKLFSEAPTSSQNLYSVPLFGAHMYAGDLSNSAIYMREAISSQLQRAFSDLVTVSDGSITVRQTRGITDFVVLQEWVNVQLIKPFVWTLQSVPVPSSQTLYGRPLFGQALFSDRILISWSTSLRPQESWTNADGQTNQES